MWLVLFFNQIKKNICDTLFCVIPNFVHASVLMLFSFDNSKFFALLKGQENLCLKILPFGTFVSILNLCHEINFKIVFNLLWLFTLFRVDCVKCWRNFPRLAYNQNQKTCRAKERNT